MCGKSTNKSLINDTKQIINTSSHDFVTLQKINGGVDEPLTASLTIGSTAVAITVKRVCTRRRFY